MNINVKNIKRKSSSDESDLSKLLDELNKYIFLFPKSSFFNQLDETSDENHHTELLIKHLTFSISKRFTFFNQPSQKGRRSVDVGVYLTDDKEANYIFCIEAKFLPTYDYVTGNFAAIKRFRKCEHGLSNRNLKLAKPLSKNGIVAYMRKGKIKEHKTKINQKIEELSKDNKVDEFGLIWNKSEQLQSMSITNKLISNHPRQNASNVQLHHFWIKVTEVVKL